MKYIIFRADWSEEDGAENRLLAHTGAMTDILAEHFDATGKPSPKPGYRFREFHQIEKFKNPRFPEASTHSRVGDWEVTRVEEYTTKTPGAGFESIVICYCQYSPVSTPLEPLPEIQVSQELQEVEVHSF
ncbi:MAG: hypothetical protein F6J86_27280 [Symploca sp. SIO1B1]|nr:hypothetical protein [Symploca sp. SIO1B1]NES17879.1 hypothetical protein [Caldora sp. SIO3E6]